MKLVVTIPAYNEGKTIGEVISKIKVVLGSLHYDSIILVVDDGSKDDTSEIAKKAGATVFTHPKNYGLAETFRTEIKKCLELDADVIVHIDADGQYSAEEMPKLLAKIDEGYDLVLGDRFKGKIEKMPMLKRLGNIAFSKVISNIVGLKINDAQTGFRAFTREVAGRIEFTSNHTYTQEQIIRAVKGKFKVTQVPINFAKRDGKSRLLKHPLEYAVKAWINLLRVYRDYEPLKFFSGIGGLLMLGGFVIAMFFLYWHFTTGIKGHLGLFFLMVLLVFSGLQVALFGFLADMNGKG